MPRTYLGDIARAAGLGNIKATAEPATADEVEEQDEVTDDDRPADDGHPDVPSVQPAQIPGDPAAAPQEVPGDSQQPPDVVARKGGVIGGGVVKTAQSFSFVTGSSRRPAAANPKPIAKAKGPVEAESYMASLEARGHRLDTAARDAIAGFEKTWSSSAEIRSEFGSFAIFASFMRAKSQGSVRILGQ